MIEDTFTAHPLLQGKRSEELIFSKATDQPQVDGTPKSTKLSSMYTSPDNSPT